MIEGETRINLSGLLKKPSAYVPIAMSIAALIVVLGAVTFFGVGDSINAEGRPDEGAAAHIFQLLMIGQVPLIGFFCIRWLRRNLKPALMVLLLQAGAGLAAIAPVFLLHL
jgi:hypothetical protein